METTPLEKLKFPIGRWEAPEVISESDIQTWISAIEVLPAKVRALAEKFSDAQLDTPYRTDGWTARQVIHHLPDSHMNAYLRFKLAATESNPTIRPYNEVLFAELPDAKAAPIAASLALLDGLHERWVSFLRGLSIEDFSKTFFHPENKKSAALDVNLSHYAWHGMHHLGHLGLVVSS